MLVGVQLLVLGLYLPPLFRYTGPSGSAPDNHFAACPDCRMVDTGHDPFDGAGDGPTIGNGIISTAGVRIEADATPPQTIISLPSTLPCESTGPRARWWCWWPSNCRCWDYISRQYSNGRMFLPPQTIISVPVHTAVWPRPPARWGCWWLSNCRCPDCISRRC